MVSDLRGHVLRAVDVSPGAAMGIGRLRGSLGFRVSGLGFRVEGVGGGGGGGGGVLGVSKP